MDKVDYLGVVDMVKIVENMVMVDNVNIVKSIDMVNILVQVIILLNYKLWWLTMNILMYYGCMPVKSLCAIRDHPYITSSRYRWGGGRPKYDT